MTAGALARGAVGVIISGRCRDLSEHRRAQFPVFARGVSTLGQSPFTRPSAVNVPLVISSPPGTTGQSDDIGLFPPVEVRPGDWMIGDDNGVVCVPKELEEKVVALAAEGREVDSRCLDDIKAGKSVQASFKLHRGKRP
jgi:regulator of RNase E activity RraA